MHAGLLRQPGIVGCERKSGDVRIDAADPANLLTQQRVPNVNMDVVRHRVSGPYIAYRKGLAIGGTRLPR